MVCKRLHGGGQNRGLNWLIGLYVDDSQADVHMTGFLRGVWVPIGMCTMVGGRSGIRKLRPKLLG